MAVIKASSMNETYDVFISFKNLGPEGQTRDSALAASIYEFLTAHKLRVFFSAVSLKALGVSSYKKAIDGALDAARILVAVGSSTENLNSEWVRYEWDSFYNDILSGMKPDGRVFVYIEGFGPSALPRTLRQTQVIIHGTDSLSQLHSFIINAIGSHSRQDVDVASDKHTPLDGKESLSQSTAPPPTAATLAGKALSSFEHMAIAERDISKPFDQWQFWLIEVWRNHHRNFLLIVVVVTAFFVAAASMWFITAQHDPLGEMKRKEVERAASLLLQQLPTDVIKHPINYQEVESFAPLDYSSYLIMSDERVVDLRMWSEIPPDKLHELHESISVDRRIRLKKIKPASKIEFEARTSGLDVYWSCRCTYPYSTIGMKSLTFVGQDRMKARRIIVDVSRIAVNEEVELRFILTYWNSLQTEREQWFGLIGYEGAFKASLLLLPPSERPFKEYALMTARTSKDQPVPYAGNKIVLSGKHHEWVYWEVPSPEPDRVYRLHFKW